jgi:drug/metabolite transporter (DMT)-like permease
LKKEVPIGIGFLVGALILFEYFLKGLWPAVSKTATDAQNWGSIISAFAMGLAAANLIVIHSRRIKQKHPDAWMSWLLFAGILVMTITGFYAKGTAGGNMFSFLFDGLYLPLGTAMFSIMVFFIASAARRAFRARNIDAVFLLVAGVIVMIGNAPIGKLISPWFPSATNWLISFPNVAGNRAIMIGAALGMVLTGFRVIVGIDRSYFGGE